MSRSQPSAPPAVEAPRPKKDPNCQKCKEPMGFGNQVNMNWKGRAVVVDIKCAAELERLLKSRK